MDLNLLIRLQALLVERSITKAAARLYLTRPAMSLVVARLRDLFDDQLVVREGSSMVLTPVAESLLPAVERALEDIETALAIHNAFDCAVADRLFTVISGNYVAELLAGPLLRSFQGIRSGLRLNWEPLRPEAGSDLVEVIEGQRCDLAFWPLEGATQELLGLPHRNLFTDELVVIADAECPDVPETLSAEQVFTLPRIHIRSRDPGKHLTQIEGPVGEQVAQSAVMTGMDLITALLWVRKTGRVTIAPRRLFDRMGSQLGLRVVPTDFPSQPLSFAMFWSPRHENSSAHRWLRDCVEKAAIEAVS